MTILKRYNDIIGEEKVNGIYEKASFLTDRHILHINSTFLGGGVAEILQSLVLLMNDVGIETGWRILHGNPDFYQVTKKIHNALQGADINLSNMKKNIYRMTNVHYSLYTHIDHDCVIIHDPQPLPLLPCCKEKREAWLWRCHIDITNPNPSVWSYLKEYIKHYDGMIVSMEQYKKQDVGIPQLVLSPSIDPLNSKNKDINTGTTDKYLSKWGIDNGKPIISQISRFDVWKDPMGVVEMFRRVREKVDCQLVLVGSFATDDPEGQGIYNKLMKRVNNDRDITIILNATDIEVNAIQRSSAAVVQKSLKEGFALTVSEALWKGTPVVASRVGGIPSQIVDGRNGYLVDDPTDLDAFADRVVRVVNDPKLAESMGEFGREYVRERFLITSHLLNWIYILALYL